MSRKNRKPRPAPVHPSAAGRYAAQIVHYADNVTPLRANRIDAAWVGDLLNGPVRPSGATRHPAGTRLHEFMEQAFRDTPGVRVQDSKIVDMAALGYPPCTEDIEPVATGAAQASIEHMVDAMVAVLNGITRELEALRGAGPPDRTDGVTQGERDAWRAACNRAITLTSGAAFGAAQTIRRP